MLMNNIIIEKTDSLPGVNFDITSKKLQIEGRSIPENAFTFYTPLITWINEYYSKNDFNTKAEVSKLIVTCDYFNSSSAKMFLYMFEALANYQKEGHLIEINWHVSQEDEEIIDMIDDIRLISEIKLNILDLK